MGGALIMADQLCATHGEEIPNNCIPNCFGVCQVLKKCTKCYHKEECHKKTFNGSTWMVENTLINLFDMNEAYIQKIMLDLRKMPKGLTHCWSIVNPNASRKHQWARINIWATRPTSLEIDLISDRLKYPGDAVCGEQRRERSFVNLRTAEKYLRRRVRALQRQWANCGASDWQDNLERRRREYMWEHS